MTSETEMSDHERELLPEPSEGAAAAPSEEAAAPAAGRAPVAAAAAPFSFGTGLLPSEALAETNKGLFHLDFLGGHLEAGLLYVSGAVFGASFSLGLDFSLAELRSPLFYRALIGEFLATLLFLYFTVAAVVYRGDFVASAARPVPAAQEALLESVQTLGAGANLMISVAFGFAAFLIVFVFSATSGAHFNPAVSVGLALTRKVTVLRAVAYSAVQMGGAVVGTLLAKAISPSAFDLAGGAVNANSNPSVFSSNGVLLGEIVGTLLLVLVVYTVVDPERSGATVSVAALQPFAIGMAVMVAHLGLVPISGCGINPARSFGPAAVAGEWTDQWIFWVGPMVGAAIAACIYELILKSRVEFEDKWRTQDASDDPPKDEE